MAELHPIQHFCPRGPERESMAGLTQHRVHLFAKYGSLVNLQGPNEGEPSARTFRQFCKRWRHHLPQRPEATILDLGCGSGEWLWCLRRLGYTKLYGVDLCQQSLRVAKARGTSNAICADALEFIDGRREQFDIVTAFNFCEHLEKRELLALLANVFRALKAGGVFLAVTPNGLSPFAGTTRYWDITHEQCFTPASWRQIARATGFSATAFEEYGPIASSLIGVTRCVLWQVVKLLIDSLSYIEVGRPRDPCRVYTADMKIILRKGPSPELP